MQLIFRGKSSAWKRLDYACVVTDLRNACNLQNASAICRLKPELQTIQGDSAVYKLDINLQTALLPSANWGLLAKGTCFVPLLCIKFCMRPTRTASLSPIYLCPPGTVLRLSCLPCPPGLQRSYGETQQLVN